MQQELQEAGETGFVYKGQTVFQKFLGDRETIVILERECQTQSEKYEYVLLATNRTATMQKELNAIGAVGFRFAGLTVAETAFGGSELVTILHRK